MRLQHSSVSDIVSLKDREKYQGITEAVVALSNGFGPVIGGLFSEYTTWSVSLHEAIYPSSHDLHTGDGRSGLIFPSVGLPSWSASGHCRSKVSEEICVPNS